MHASAPEVPLSSPPRASRLKRWIIGVVLLLAVFAGLVAVKAGQIVSMINAGETFVLPPESVTSTQAESFGWQGTRSAVGTVMALRGVTLSAELPGVVNDIRFENGASVKKGQVLVQLDTSSEQAQLAGAEADAELSRLNRERAEKLNAQGANTQSDLDAVRARSLQSSATVAHLKSLIAKKTIRAPFDGRIGIRQVELGQLVSPGNPIASLQSSTPALVEFQLPQQALAQVKQGQKVRLRVDVFPGESWEGDLTTINPEVELSSRNVRMRATVPNADGRLLPGMFASVEVLSDASEQVVAIPATAVLFAPYGDSVFTLSEGKDAAGKAALLARQQFVRLGERRGDYVAVTSGLKPGQTVVSSGVFKLKNGMAVVVNNALAPPVEVAPLPVNP
ncbi:efflux RND transporter periplasmic adaptor subunit [Corallococcus exiguus]|uniref:efflux RND transporter periplasmic adaptor subunit n=1 Tax=Corallococcus TaxID=83461 RepID=UPI000EA218C4|nr:MULTISPECIES: efflux RND transporter periplasmic adaptor subunit [Corallococcus]NNC16244.1 efflux RND transporter periplasmic adaptor subunit [Corallococcus exiguus]NRD60697.1 efflux RND transporter periplasmic adaptor subunit [Corallococcus exiguus]RKH29948.1 efflux RND transporter periplasmic adaptor subunit [Corallococcus sp. CA041A]RKI17079.1 efflux RND transporter periplasmic adaptor subunit [Corallococcus sp. AB030]RUO94332.1 efflux RND transporter periplasmic adaptor subunit [Corallo